MTDWCRIAGENKTRDLFSYREDVVVTLKSLIPQYRADESHLVPEAAAQDSTLCWSCLSTLSHNLYYSPVRFEPYLAEASTRAYLTLM